MNLWPRRRDGTPARNVSPERKLMPLLMRSRAESVVFAEEELDLRATLPWLQARRDEGQPLTLFHVVLWALGQTLHARPGLNRFVAGGRLYERNGVHLSFSAKRQRDDSGHVATVKLEASRGESVQKMSERVRAMLEPVRGDVERPIDREVSLVSRLPPWLLGPSVRAVRALDSVNLLPARFIAGDPLYASAFVAHLGSVGVRRAYHHLYEYGTVSVFVVLGAVHERLRVDEAGVVTSGPCAALTFAFDERVHDGLYAARSLSHLRSLLERPG